MKRILIGCGILVVVCLVCGRLTVTVGPAVARLGVSGLSQINPSIGAEVQKGLESVQPLTGGAGSASVDYGSNTGNTANPSCSGAPTTRMTKNGRGQVSITPDHVPTRLRRGPSTSAGIISAFADGTPFTVQDTDPVCADSFLWWSVRLDSGQTGWMAEGNAVKYFIEPR